MATLLYFGKLMDVTGASQEVYELPESVCDTARLREVLDARFEGQGVFLDTSVRLAVNDEIVAEPYEVSNADTVAFMPPVGGG